MWLHLRCSPRIEIYALLSLLQMKNRFPDEEKYLRDYCADSAFVHVLLISGYGFNNLFFPHISFQEKVSPEQTFKISWIYPLNKKLFCQDKIIMLLCIAGWRHIGWLGPWLHVNFKQPPSFWKCDAEKSTASRCLPCCDFYLFSTSYCIFLLSCKNLLQKCH